MNRDTRRWLAAAATGALIVALSLTGAAPAAATTITVPATCAGAVSSLSVRVGDIVEIPVQGAGCTLVNNSATGNLTRVSANGFVAFAEGTGAVFALVESTGTQFLTKINVTITPAPQPTPTATPSTSGTPAASSTASAVASPTPSPSTPSATPSAAPSTAAPAELADESAPLPSQRLTAKDISFDAGPDDGTLVVTSDNGNPIQLLSVTTDSGEVDVVSAGLDFANPANWQQLGYGDICWGNTGFGNATAAVLPVATPPFRTVPADWALSAAIVVTRAGNTTFLDPTPGDVVSSDGTRIRSLILCSRAQAPSTRSAALDHEHGGSHKITICHIPPGNSSNAHTITVSSNAARAHFAHGDYVPTAQSPCGTPITIAQPSLPPTQAPQPTVSAKPDEVIGYCLATRSRQAPYEFAEATASQIRDGSIIRSGPLFPTPGWGDIVPAFSGYPGQNWPAGLNLLTEDLCEMPASVQVEPTPTVSPVATATAVATPTATPTSSALASPTASPALTPTPTPYPTPPLRPQPTVIASPTVPQATPTLPTATPTPVASAPAKPPVVVAPTIKPDPPTLPVVIVPVVIPTPQSSAASATATPSTRPSSSAAATPTAVPSGSSTLASPLATPTSEPTASVAGTPTAVPSGSSALASPLASPPISSATSSATSSPTPTAVATGAGSAGPGSPGPTSTGPGSTGPGGSPAATPISTAIPTPGLVTMVVTNGPSTVTITVPFTTLEHKASKTPTRTTTEHLATTGRDDVVPAVVTIVLIAGAAVIVLRRRRWATATAVTFLVIGVGTSSQAAWSAVSESRAYDIAQAQAAGSWKASGALASLSFHRDGAARPVAGRETFVFRGVDAPALAKGPGWYTSTARPGAAGNVAIAGHRTGFGSPFAHLDEARPGDEITMRTAVGTSTRYVVRRVALVAPDADWVLGPDPLGTGEPTLTLTTCDPPHVNSHRLIVFATQAK